MKKHDYEKFTNEEDELSNKNKELERALDFVGRHHLNIFLFDNPDCHLWMHAISCFRQVHAFVPTDVILKTYSDFSYHAPEGDAPLSLFRDELLGNPRALSALSGDFGSVMFSDFLHAKNKDYLAGIIRSKPLVYLSIRNPTPDQTTSFLLNYPHNQELPQLTKGFLNNMIYKHLPYSGAEDLLRNYCVGSEYRGLLIPDNRDAALSAAKHRWCFTFSETKDTDLQKEVIAHNPLNYRWLLYPHSSVTEYAVEKYPELIVFIKDPSKKVVEIVKRLRPDNCGVLLTKKKYKNLFMETEFYQFGLSESKGYK